MPAQEEPKEVAASALIAESQADAADLPLAVNLVADPEQADSSQAALSAAVNATAAEDPSPGRPVRSKPQEMEAVGATKVTPPPHFLSDTCIGSFYLI